MSDSQELLEMRFKRYLHYGSELPLYKCGNRYTQKYYSKDKVPSLLEIIDKEENNAEYLVEIILEVKQKKASLYEDALIFALAVCAQQQKRLELTKRAYAVLPKICDQARDLILFVKFYTELKEKKGGGSGFKRAISKWYSRLVPFDLAHMFLDQNSYFGWTHGDVLRIAHVKPHCLEHGCLYTYATYGVDKAFEKWGKEENENVQELLEYMRSVHDIKRATDPIESEKTIRVELHNIERIPTHLLKHAEIWNLIIPYMKMDALLNNIQRLSILGFLKNTKTANILMTTLDRESRQYKGHPSRIYIELMTYEKAAQHVYAIATKLNHPISKITPARKPPKCNFQIQTELMKCYNTVYDAQVPTNLKYFVAVDLRPKMFTDRCLYSMYLSPAEAAQVICHSLVRTEPAGNVTVGVFVEPRGTIELLPCEKDWDINKFKSTFEDMAKKNGPTSVASAIYWADKNDILVDVIVVLSNYAVATAGARPAIKDYRTNKKLPNTKVITCSLSGQLRSHKHVEGQNMMCSVGFDQHVCRLIERFGQGAF